jgi:hypothetical protein
LSDKGLKLRGKERIVRNRLIGFAVLFGILLGSFLSSRRSAASDAAGPQTIPLHLEGALISAAGDTVKFLNVPAGEGHAGTPRDADFKYYDIECHLSLMTDGSASVERVTATPSARVPESAEHFISGKYELGNVEIAVAGPAMTISGRFVWSFSEYVSGSWTTGPVEGHPQLTLLLLPTDAVLPGGYSYGYDSSGNLIAVQQAGNEITISWLKPVTDKDHPHVFGVDHAMVWTLEPTAAQPK